MVVQVAWALVAAVALAWSAVLEHGEARRQPAHLALTPRLLAGLLMRRRWLAGIGVGILGISAQALALHAGPVTTVQVIKTSSVAFALLFAAAGRMQRLRRRDLVLVIALLVSMGAFLVSADPTGGRSAHGLRPWLAPSAITMGLAGAALAAAARCSGRSRAVALGAATGIIWAYTSLLLKASTADVAGLGVGALSQMAPWALLVVGFLGTIINQSAFQAGELIWSLPAITVVEPVVGSALAVLVFDERLQATGGAARAIAVVGALVALVSAAGLGHHLRPATGATDGSTP